MTTSPRIQPAHLTAPRPFLPTMRQRNNRSPGLATGSATQTLTNTPQRSESPEPLVLRLRGVNSPQPDMVEANVEGTNTRRRARIQWAEDVIDNEGLGRKKSKVCCIYHKPRPAGESSDESSSGSSSDSDSDLDVGTDGARPVAGRNGRGRRQHNHRRDNVHDASGSDCGHAHETGRKAKKGRKPSPNAYERMPKYDVKPLTQQPEISR